jgi:hypothetical protein
MRYVLFLLAVAPAVAADPVPMFNGKDLSGWVNVNGAPSTWKVVEGTVITTGKPTGFLRTARMYENFVLEMDWMHVNKKEVGNSGLFVWGDALPAVGTGYTRGIEVQVLVNYPDVGWATNHGDLFSIWGAKCTPDRPHPRGIERCLPSENRCKGGGEWNHYKVTAKDGAIKLEVNGKEVSGVSNCSPRKGYLALEAEGAECHFKNVVITELPSSDPKPESIATADRGHKPMTDGLTMTGWNAAANWSVGDGIYRSKGIGDFASQFTVKQGELVFDWKLPEKSTERMKVTLGKASAFSYTNESKNDGKWHRAILTADGTGVSFTIDGKPHGKASQVIDEGPIAFNGIAGLELRSIYWRGK